MSPLIEKLVSAQKHAFSVRPKVGGFPVLAEVLRQAGVIENRWALPSCQSVYVMKEGSVVQQGEPLVKGQFQVPEFNQAALVEALRTDQAGNSSFPEFLQAAWNAGVISYDVDFEKRKVTYFGVNGEFYTEEYPVVKVPVPGPQ
ncbi:DUF1398 family protein [Bdellovibrio sp. HCB274]|uniref:DUF1398 family protein n=1 Tax=Bdellovibrio sp. HCB274 TaxID=3394361 RepID=UPI0039B42163